MPPKKSSYGGKRQKRKTLQYEERAAMGTQGARGNATAESVPAAARRHSATYRRRESNDSAASSVAETPEQSSRMSVTAGTPNSRKRKSRAAEAVNVVLAPFSPESQASLLAAQHSMQSTAAGMQIYEENLNIAGLTSKIGEQFVVTFKSLQKIAQNLKSGTISERKTARNLKGHLLAGSNVREFLLVIDTVA
jgi:hypothetical protein